MIPPPLFLYRNIYVRFWGDTNHRLQEQTDSFQCCRRVVCACRRCATRWRPGPARSGRVSARREARPGLPGRGCGAVTAPRPVCRLPGRGSYNVAPAAFWPTEGAHWGPRVRGGRVPRSPGRPGAEAARPAVKVRDSPNRSARGRVAVCDERLCVCFNYYFVSVNIGGFSFPPKKCSF